MKKKTVLGKKGPVTLLQGLPEEMYDRVIKGASTPVSFAPPSDPNKEFKKGGRPPDLEG